MAEPESGIDSAERFRKPSLRFIGTVVSIRIVTMKVILLALLASLATLHAAPVPSQTVERWQTAAVIKYPALKQPGSPLNVQFLALIAEKRKSEPAFFTQPDWPLRAADAVAAKMQAEELAAKEKAKAEDLAYSKMSKKERREVDEKEEKAEKAENFEKETERKKDQWIFDRLVFGDTEENIMTKLYASTLVTSRVGQSARVELDLRFRWVIGETKFNIGFEFKNDHLSAMNFNCVPERPTELDTLIREDWDRLRAAAIERFGPPTKSAAYPTVSKLQRGGITVTDVWERPGRPIALGIKEEEGKCNPTLRISDPSRGAATPGL